MDLTCSWGLWAAASASRRLGQPFSRMTCASIHSGGNGIASRLSRARAIADRRLDNDSPAVRGYVGCTTITWWGVGGWVGGGEWTLGSRGNELNHVQRYCCCPLSRVAAEERSSPCSKRTTPDHALGAYPRFRKVEQAKQAKQASTHLTLMTPIFGFFAITRQHQIPERLANLASVSTSSVILGLNV